jgi:hypothetical protein
MGGDMRVVKWRSRKPAIGIGLVGLLVVAALPTAISSAAQGPTALTHNISKLYAGARTSGELDCNGNSPAQTPLRGFNCTDIKGLPGVSNQNNWNNRFWDNGVYIGHDEPDATFLSNKPSSGNNVMWHLTLGADPTALPTVASPGRDVSHYFQLSPAPWLSMALCDGNSYPQLPCVPNSNANAPAKCSTAAAKCSPNLYPGGGSAFMEMQFYPPGNAPWIDSTSCDNTHWCAALTIDSLECTDQYGQCNTNCEEPINFAFIQTDGVPAGPPSPQLSDRASAIPNAKTLLMNPGDTISVHIANQAVPGEPGQHALMIVVHDSTTGQTGFMQASAKNGFQNTSIVNCSGTPFNFQPEYNTAASGNFIPWAALQTNISTEFEIGHFEVCTSLTNALASNPFDPSDVGGTYNGCTGPYETAGGAEGPETGDALCYAAGDVHAGYDGNPSDTVPPNEVSGCQNNLFQNGDLDFDGSGYYGGEWPTSASVTPRLPSSFIESLPQTNGGRSYAQLFFQTDVALSEMNCGTGHPSGCVVPPRGPGHFYPYWSEANHAGTCTLEFGNVHTGVATFSKDAQYGSNKLTLLGYPEFVGKTFTNSCPAH